MARLGVDTGGTFTDFVWLDENGRLRILKQLSTPADPSQAILAGIHRIDFPDKGDVVHGSTVATNALLERKGAATALIATAGFGDVLAIGRQNRPDIYALVPRKVDPLVPAKWRFEVAERVNSAGEVQTDLDEAALEQICGSLLSEGIESVAVCLLFSFLWPEHERIIARTISERLGNQRAIHLSISSDILPEFREYERASTTVINAYVAPLMSRYLSQLKEKLGERHLSVMQSNGGVINAGSAGSEAARTVLSGPAGGVVGAQYVAQLAGFRDVITFDMGGTSTDVALCPGHLPETATGDVAGLPLHLPIIDIHTVGAGGGSLAYLDLGGALHVGPQSAGAVPGPASYGLPDGTWRLEVQGENVPYRVTTTDANLILNRLDADNFLGGRMQLDAAAAERNLLRLAEEMGLESAALAAWEVVRVANAAMERAIRRISVERGFDPRRFTLVAFGGAGPLHACELAEQLQIPRVLVPAVPGVLSAMGMLVAAPAKDYSRTVMISIEGDAQSASSWLNEQFAELKALASTDMVDEGYTADDLAFEPALDMRYAGQAHELSVPYSRYEMARVFHQAHERRFGYQRPDARLEIVNIRLKVIAGSQPLILEQLPAADNVREPKAVGEKDVWFEGLPQRAGMYQREDLTAMQTIDGPAVIFQYDSTIVIPPMWQASVDGYGNLMIVR
jgi:N-methylhydantoinase A